MPTPIDEDKSQRYKTAIEEALREGFAPFRAAQGEGKGSAVEEARRRLIERGETIGKTGLSHFIYTQERRQAKGKSHFLPDWTLYSRPGVAPGEIRQGQVFRWLLTAAQDDTDVHQAFWSNLQAYAQYIGAKILVGGFTYQTMRHTDRMTLTKTYRRELHDFLRFDPIDLGPALFCAEMNTLPTAVRPLSGLLTYSRGRDAVFPHAKLAYQTVPQMPGEYVPSLMTTGAVTVPNYIQKKAGQKAKFHHVLGATLVEVDETQNVWCRQIHATQNGAFQDLDAKVADGRVTRGHRVKAIVYGDVHLPSLEQVVFENVWGLNRDAMLEALRPEYQFFHDLLSFEFYSRHVQGDPIHRAKMVFSGQSSMQGHVSEGVDFLRLTLREWCRSVEVYSNHPDRLRQWAVKTCERTDVENSMFWHACNIAMLEAEKNQDSDFDLYRWAMRKADPDTMAQIEFVPKGGSFKICQEHGGIEHGLHGDEGPNGSRGSAQALARMGAKVTIGDKHSPEILDGVYVAGMTGDLDQGYNTGPSSWRRAHVVTYENGKRTIVTQAGDGRWRA